MANDILEALEESLSGLYVPTMGAPWEEEGDGIIAGDIHSPYTNWVWAARLAQVARVHLKPPRTLYIGGDLFSNDKMSRYTPVVEPPSWATERDAVKAMFDVWLDTFDRILVVMGNHDRLIQKWTEGAFDVSDILSLITTNDRIRLNNYGWCTISTKHGVYRVTHPRNYSINRLTVANDLAYKFEQHIISFHEHHVGISWGRWGKYLIINGGCIVNPDKLVYATLDDNKSPKMQNGFVMLKDGIPTLFGDEPMTDWSQYD